MPPKNKISREIILDAALRLVRIQGVEALNARSIALAVGCSTQPVFSNFSSMEELKLAVVEKGDEIFNQFMQRQIEQGKYPPYKASGMAYIRFAKEERELFKLLYMRNRREEKEVSQSKTDEQMDILVHNGTGLSYEEGKLFHLEMWATVHGLAVMAATDYIELDEELVSRILTDTFQGLKSQFSKE